MGKLLVKMEDEVLGFVLNINWSYIDMDELYGYFLFRFVVLLGHSDFADEPFLREHFDDVFLNSLAGKFWNVWLGGFALHQLNYPTNL